MTPYRFSLLSLIRYAFRLKPLDVRRAPATLNRKPNPNHKLRRAIWARVLTKLK